MRRTLDRLVWRALLIVDAAAEHAENGVRVQPTPALRYALAFLYSRSDGSTFNRLSQRQIFNELWRVVTEEGSGTPYVNAYSRGTHTRTCLQQIGRQLQLGTGIFHEVR